MATTTTPTRGYTATKDQLLKRLHRTTPAMRRGARAAPTTRPATTPTTSVAAAAPTTRWATTAAPSSETVGTVACAGADRHGLGSRRTEKQEDEMVYPAKVTERKRLSPHVSVEMKRTSAPVAPSPR